MAFCAKCGSELQSGSGFCANCGTPVNVAAPVGFTPVPGTSAPQQQPQPVVVAPVVVTAPPPVSSGSILKVVLIVVAVLALCAVLAIAGVVYMVHRTVAKVKQAASDAGVSMSDIQSVGNTEHIDPCKYLSAADVSAGIGIKIIEAKSDDSGCHYIAKGSAANFTMGHISAMMGGQKIPAIPGVTSDASPAADDETTSLVDVSVQPRGGRAQMKIQKALLGGLAGMGATPKGGGDLTGIGDEAWVVGNNMLEARKGDMYITLTFTNCPCSSVQIAPLAKKLVDAL